VTIRQSLALISISVLLAAVSVAPRAEALPESLTVVAKSLAEHYGVPGDSVTALLEKGVSMESVTQLLLVKESSGQSFDKVTDLYSEQGKSIQKTAEELDVAAEKYSAENVQAAIDKAKADTTASAKKKASEESSKAIDSLMGGLTSE
jgi:hypothetical protein